MAAVAAVAKAARKMATKTRKLFKKSLTRLFFLKDCLNEFQFFSIVELLLDTWGNFPVRYFLYKSDQTQKKISSMLRLVPSKRLAESPRKMCQSTCFFLKDWLNSRRSFPTRGSLMNSSKVLIVMYR